MNTVMFKHYKKVAVNFVRVFLLENVTKTFLHDNFKKCPTILPPGHSAQCVLVAIIYPSQTGTEYSMFKIHSKFYGEITRT